MGSSSKNSNTILKPLPGPSEKQIENEILDNLNRAGFFAWKVDVVGIYDQDREAYRKKGKFQLKGQADINCVVPGGRTIYFEAKDGKGKQSESQKAFESKIKRMGGEYALVRSWADVKTYLTENGHWPESKA